MMKLFTSTTVIFLALVFGSLEFIDWLLANKGLIGGGIYNLGLGFFLLQNPLISLYLLLPLGWSEIVLTEIRDGILARSPLMFSEWIPKLFWFFQGLSYFTLAVQFRYIIIGLFTGKKLEADTFGYTFVLILFLTLLIQLVLRNLPSIKTVMIRYLTLVHTQERGLYALNNQQFALEDVVGVTINLGLINGPKRIYKDQNKFWFVFQQDYNHIQEEGIEQDVKYLRINYSYFVNVTNNPQQINLIEVRLSQVNSDDQLVLEIRRKFQNLFDHIIYLEQEDQNLRILLDNYLLNYQMNNNYLSLASAMAQSLKLETARLAIDEITYRIKCLSGEYYFNGNLFYLTVNLNQVELKPEIITRFSELETQLKNYINEEYQRYQNQQQIALELIQTLVNSDEIIPYNIREQILVRVINKIFPDSIDREQIVSDAIDYLTPDSRNNEYDNKENNFFEQNFRAEYN